LVHLKWESLGRLGPGGTHEEATEGRRSGPIAPGGRSRPGQGLDGRRHLPKARHRPDHLPSLAPAPRSRPGRHRPAVPATRGGGRAAEAPGRRADAGQADAPGPRQKKVVTPGQQRAAADYLSERYGISQRRAGRVMGRSRSTLRYRPRPGAGEPALTRAIKRLARRHPRYGYPPDPPAPDPPRLVLQPHTGA